MFLPYVKKATTRLNTVMLFKLKELNTFLNINWIENDMRSDIIKLSIDANHER